MRIYLDHQSATPVLPEAEEAMLPYLRGRFGNASGLHAEGFAARDALARAREQFAGLFGAETAEAVIFTGNGTEAVNLAIKGSAFANQRRGRHIVVTKAEHPAVARSVEFLATAGFSATEVAVDSDGRVDPGAYEAALQPDTILACVHHANHDIGTVQDVAAIGRITSERGVPLFVDAIASAGWLPMDVQQWQADLVAISPNRFYGPKGVGALYRNRRARLTSLIHGGEQEGGYRAGTENVAAIAGGGVAAEIAVRELGKTEAHARALQIRALSGLNAQIDYLKLNGPGPGPRRHPANLNISIEFVEGEALGLMLDVKGIAVATGSACVSKEQRVPPVLAAIGLPESLARGNVLFSFGRENSVSEINQLIEVFTDAVRRLREMSPEWEDFQKGRSRSILEKRAGGLEQ